MMSSTSASSSPPGGAGQEQGPAAAPPHSQGPPLPPSFAPHYQTHPRTLPASPAPAPPQAPSPPHLDAQAALSNGYAPRQPLQGTGDAPAQQVDQSSSASLPVSILNSAATTQKRDPFQGLSRAEGGAVYGCDLEEDANTGAHSCAPFVRFTASSICNQKRITNVSSLGFGAILCPAPASQPPLPTARREPTRCERCGAYANLYCSIVPSSGEWCCPFCAHRNLSGSLFAVMDGDDFASWSELSQRGVDYVVASSTRLQHSGLPQSEPGFSSPLFLLLDESLDAPSMSQLQASLQLLLTSLPPTVRVCLLSFGASVGVFDLGHSALAKADVYPGHTTPTQDTVEALLYSPSTYLAPLHACLPALQSIVASLRPFRGTRAPAGVAPRCLGVALEVALILIRRYASRTPHGGSRIMVCTSGPITAGPGSIPESDKAPQYSSKVKKAAKYVDELGHEARSLDTAIDILCGSLVPPRASLLKPLAALSGGVVLLLDGFGPATFGASAVRAVSRTVGSHGLLEIRTSKSLSVSRVIGPASELSRRAAALLASGSQEVYPGDSAVMVELRSVEQGQSITLCIDMLHDEPRDFVFFQFAFRFFDAFQSALVRVFTLRLPTTGSVPKYLSSVDQEAAIVMIAKRTILAASNADSASEQRTWVEARAKDIAIRLGKPVPKSNMLKFPNELPGVIEALYHLQRSPLLGRGGGSSEHQSVLRDLLLQAAPDTAQRMVLPSLLMFRPGTGQPPMDVPAADLALLSDAALLLDHGTDIFIWIGADLAAKPSTKEAAEEECRRVAQSLAAHRFPVPSVVTFLEGSEECSFFLALLVPAHKDPLALQELRFPPLREMLPDERARLKAKQMPTEEESFCEWMRRLRLVVPDPA